MICKTDVAADNVAALDEMLFKAGIDVDSMPFHQAEFYRFMYQCAYVFVGVCEFLKGLPKHENL